MALSIPKKKFVLAFALGQRVVLGIMLIAVPRIAFAQQPDTVRTAPGDTTQNRPYTPSRKPTFKPADRYGDPFSNSTNESPLFLKDPAQMKLDVEIDTSGNYTIYEKIGDLNYRPTSSMSLEEFKQYQDRQILREYWQSRARAQDGESAVSGRSLIPKIFISPVLDRIFGGSYVELVPRGFVTLDFGGSFQKINNPSIPIRQQRNGGFEFDQQINMSVVGKVGEKLAITANFDNNNSFDFQNNMKVEYTGFKEDILQKLEIGNVSLPLNNTLIQGSQNLFGIKAQLQFGKLNVTTIATTQRGKTSSIDIAGGGPGGAAQGRPFEIIASNYDENRHFFLGHFFRDNYAKWVANTPQIISGVTVTRVEVYVLNRATETQTLRNVLAFMDLGEGTRIYNKAAVNPLVPGPNDNDANDLYAELLPHAVNGTIDAALRDSSFQNGLDFEKINGARRLADTEFTFHPQLGYITLNRKLQNDEALAVSYEYTYNGKAYKVGELSEDYSKRPGNASIFMKLLRPRKVAIRDRDKNIIPTWLLMMKNIYSLGVNQVGQEGFQLRIIYKDDVSGIDNPQLQEGPTEVRAKQLVEIFGLDRLNAVNDPPADGNFDFVEGVTINTENGLIIFPTLEPFSESLRRAFKGDINLIRKYAYDTLYRTTKADAELFATKNKFWLKGFYNASGGSAKEILIPGFGVAPGSVKLYAGDIPLTENIDYVVDYTFGKVTILNDAILNSGKDIEVQYEQNDPFAFQTRSLLGTRFDYRLNEDVNFGSTFLYYNERPLVTRNQIGTEPARNMQYGFDFNINKKSRLLTKMVDAIPLIQTKEPSSINFTGEFAQLLPGTSNVVDGEGTAFVDDFESSATPYSLMNPFSWKLAAVPESDTYSFDESNGAANDIRAGFRRAKLAWYTIDPQIQGFTSNSNRPGSISENDLNNHYVRGVVPQEIFPQRDKQQAMFSEQILDLAYYPRERGPYNYNWLEMNGRFLSGDLKRNWAGITTAIRTEVDFDKANIEYIEFWLLDPFIQGENGVINDGFTETNQTNGGKLIFQLGSISEDVIRDGKHAFENGLPPGGAANNPQSVTETPWGFVTTQNYLTNGFDNTSTSSRANQDVGLDGLANDEEAAKFDAPAEVLDDPSADNYRHFLDNYYDNAEADILQRYKDYNGQDGNTPISSNTATIATANYQNPDNEDLNADNTLSELEEYYEYDIDLSMGNMAIGKEYIVDKQNSDKGVTWYLFRIPVREYESLYGNIQGFKSIRYARMILTGFDQPVVLRMANFRMVGSRWRRYTDQLRDGGLIGQPEPNSDNFNVSVVNVEENSEGDSEGNKSPYVIPPGAVRDRDNSSAVSRLLNEQSLQVCIDNLEDGDARAVYKNMAVDLFNYGRIKMFLHANSLSEDDDLRAFIRLGTDFDENYYEIEIPLKITKDVSSRNDREVWPEENEIDLALSELYALKAERDRRSAPLTEVFPREGHKQVGRHGIRIMGRPDLSSVQLIMIGVRNPKTNDKRSHSVCIWANELRATDFDRTAGWAVSSTLSAKLADFAVVTGSFRHTTFGFGGVSSKIFERTREETTNYDVAANVNVDKFIPGNTGIKIPMYVSYENSVVTPLYDPANPDMRTEDMLRSFDKSDPEDRRRRDEYLNIIQDRMTRRSLNFTNVRKVKVNPDGPTHLWDIENFAFSYSFSEAIRTNFNTSLALQKQQGGSVAYQFAPKASGFEPFKDSKALSSPWLGLIKDFNFNLMPSSIGARLDLERSFGKTIYRNVNGVGEFVESDANYLKYFTFNRTYNLRWDLTKSLSFDYNSRANAIIDEPFGDIDTKEERDSVMTNLKRFGRMKNFNQSLTMNYKVPLDKIPVTDWIGLDYRYQVMYDWTAGPVNLVQNDTLDLDFKNLIQNSREQDFSGRLDLVQLYNKIKFLKALNTPPRPVTTRPGATNPRAQAADTTQAKGGVPGVFKGLAKLLMSVRSINGTYTVSEGTTLPGFTKTPSLLGMDNNWEAPGWSFILGSQNPGFRYEAADKGWITTNQLLTAPFAQSRMVNINVRANVEPVRDFKVQLDFKKETMDTYQEIYRNTGEGNEIHFESLNPNRSGSYRVSTISIKTAFNKSNSDVESEVFQKFEENLTTIHDRFEDIREFYGSDVPYDTTGQDVLIPAFIAAYTGKNAQGVSLSPFPKNPMPNWRVDYTGLTRVGIFKDIFQSITISHAYQSMYAITNYSNSLEFDDPNVLRIDRKIEDYNTSYYGDGVGDNRLPVYVINQVLISEQFAPLIGINVRTKSRLTANLQYKTKRDVALNISNAQITELNSKDVSLEVGFTKTNMKLPFKSQGRRIVLKNDLTFRLNATIGDTRTIQRKIGELNIITNGNINFQLRPNVSYTVNQKLTVQLYFERNINEPLISNSSRRATTRFGAQVRFSLAQ